MVFVVVIMAQLFAFVVVLVSSQTAWPNWEQLGLVALFIQWCALSSSAVLCLLRPWLAAYSHRIVALVSYLLVILVVWLVSELAYWYVYPNNEQIDHWSFVLRNVVIAIILTGPALRYFYVQHQWRAKVRTEAEARLQALQSRIRPHFLFNSMNTIASLTRIHPERAETAVEDLADLFRAAMRDNKTLHTLGEEWDLCRRYLAIETLRLGERLKVNWAVEALPEDAYLPPLLIQPLLENAIYHGIETRTEGGTINLSGQFENQQLKLQIENPVPTRGEHSQQGNQLAQNNIYDRLTTLFGNKGDMQVMEQGERYIVVLTWPYWNRLDENIDR